MTHPNPTDRFAIISVPSGPAPDDAIVVGSMSDVMEYIPQSAARQDAVEQLEHARFSADQITSMQEKTRGVQAAMLADSISHLSSRLDALVTRRDDAARARAKAEEEAEHQRIQDELASLPDPDDPAAHGHIPGGELHTLSPPQPPKGEPDAEGDLPEELTDPLEPEPGPTGTVFPQPTAISLNED